MHKKQTRVFAIILFLIVLSLVILILKPFISAIIIAIIIAYLFHPVYRYFVKKTKKETLSAFLTSVLVVLLLTIPFLLMINTVSKEVLTFSKSFKERMTSGEIFEVDCDETPNSTLCKVNTYLSTVSEESTIDHYLATGMNRLASNIASATSRLILQIPLVILNIFVMLFTTFYLFRDGEKLIKVVKNVIPVNKKNTEHIISQSAEVLNGVLYGQLVTALIQGMIAGLGYYLFGFSSPIFWGIVTAIAALIPIVGTGLIWLPMALYSLTTGLSTSNRPEIIAGTGLMIYGAILISSLDNIIKPKLIGDRAKIHPLLVLLGVLGGLSLFGPLGVIIGPIILALFVVLIEIYRSEKILG
ncbi:AI-2E family transporter [Candidatus Woesearchaeota archaeon]|jgi:predicted PurR-regulated permease PerM|nr:AI-2E family transporter [Candidatus Woesearchaeota archaeon]MBT3538360.1 AI-2E family transporter [Candidatus Woesearchaeota archaeon]MBT4717158.1 AI-2E family transporter [Candidatus Woesearchaeota archaeon]MBT7106029.1 AI-2E family transporter [Candidatus Woesearchaeota archaeon]MBT7930366.1 AI-2E family transporter [Candidatus Woesearchaeota archaeon]